MLNIRVRNSRRSLPEQVRKAELVIVDLDALVAEFPLPERSVGKELTDYFQWKYDRDLVFDPLYGCIQKLSEYAGGGLVNEAQQILGEWEAHALSWAKPRESVVGLMRRLTDEGVIVAVTADRMQNTATGLLRRFGLAFSVDMVVGGDDVDWPRPNPEALELVLGAMGISREETVFIGSRRSDIDMGRRARVATHLHQTIVPPDPTIRIAADVGISRPLILAG